MDWLQVLLFGKKSKKRQQAFDFHSLILEMQAEVRSHLQPSSRSFLAMTCRTEYACATNDDRSQLLYRLAYEDDEEHLIACLSTPDFARHYQGPPGTTGLTHSKALHKLMHEAIRGGHTDLVKWFFGDVGGLFEWKTCDHACLQVAVRRVQNRDDFQMLDLVLDMHCVERYKCHAMHSNPGTWTILVTEIIRHGNMELIEYCSAQGRTRKHVDLFWDCNQKEHYEKEREALFPNLLDQPAVLKWAFRHLGGKLCRHLFYCALHSAVARQWTVDKINLYFRQELRDLDEDIDVYARRLFVYAVWHENRQVVDWALTLPCSLETYAVQVTKKYRPQLGRLFPGLFFIDLL